MLEVEGDVASVPGTEAREQGRSIAARLDRGPQVGATGAHGAIRYEVDRYQSGSTICFRFTAPQGLQGGHRFEVLSEVGGCRLRHVLEGRTTGPRTLSPAVSTSHRSSGHGASACPGGASQPACDDVPPDDPAPQQVLTRKDQPTLTSPAAPET